MRRILLAVALLTLSSNAFAWGEAGHLMSNEAATLSLPAGMPLFFYRSFPELVWLGYQPDRLHNAGPSFEPTNAPDHFLNEEMVEGLDLPLDRYKYLALLYSSGRLAHLGVSNTEPGFSPWRVAEMSELLTAEFRQWRFSAPDSPERTAIEGEIISTAGVMGHFVADEANPLHDTVNYNGWVMANPNGYANDCQIHARFETNFVSRAITTPDITARVAPPVLRTDYFETALAFIRSSQSLVEELYGLDKRGAFDPIASPSAEGKRFAAGRLAAGSSLLRDLWWSAWQNSAKAPKRRGES